MTDEPTFSREHRRSCALGSIPFDSKLLARWDACEIADRHASWLIEQAREDGDELSDQAARQLAWEDQDLYTHEWGALIKHLGELMAERNPDGEWECAVSNFGWRGLSGHQYFHADDGKDFLAAILPDCDCTFKIFDYPKGEAFAIQNWHHDSPVGREWYYVTTDKRIACSVCGDKYEPDDLELCRKCPECKTRYCNYCFGDGDVCLECLPGNYTSYEVAVSTYKEFHLPAIRERYEQDGKPDIIARREAWNNYTDALCKDGLITPWQYENWDHPSCVEGD